MTYKVLTEDETIDRALAGASIARFGDGELRLALGGSAASQVADPKLARELQLILAAGEPELVCIPNPRSPKVNWRSYETPKFISMYGAVKYGSAFISRPDSAPWIDTPEYWAKVEKLWTGKDVIFVKGDDRSLRTNQLDAVRTLHVIPGIGRDAYRYVDMLELGIESAYQAIKHSLPIVIMCLGATATVLAHRLACKGIHALDLGHMGMFMRHAGSYNYDNTNLISVEYREQNRLMHEGPEGFGGSGWKHAAAVLVMAKECEARSILDYGCGEGTLKIELAKRCAIPVKEYDPAVAGKEAPPKPADLVVCTDVVEHVEPDKLDAVLAHIRSLTCKVCFIVIATRPANKTLPDGRNTHLIIKHVEWWMPNLKAAGFEVNAVDTNSKRIVACLVPV